MGNKILENAGICDVVLTAYSDFTAGGTEYEKDDIVALFKKVPVGFNYSQLASQAEAKGTKLYYSNKVLNEVALGGVPLTDKLLSLFSTTIQNYADKLTIVDAPLTDNKIFLPLPPNTEKPIRILGKKGSSTPYTYDIIYNTITFTNELPNGAYTLIYFVKDTNAKTYNINDKNAHIPYLSLHISNIGNIDKIGKATNIFIPKVSLIDSPMLSISKEDITYYNVLFKVIDGDCFMGF